MALRRIRPLIPLLESNLVDEGTGRVYGRIFQSSCGS